MEKRFRGGCHGVLKYRRLQQIYGVEKATNGFGEERRLPMDLGSRGGYQWICGGEEATNGFVEERRLGLEL